MLDQGALPLPALELAVDDWIAARAAEAMVAGRNANGRTHWTVQGTIKTYGEWQDEQVTKAAAQVGGSAMPDTSAVA